jgi:hypothetical protein
LSNDVIYWRIYLSKGGGVVGYVEKGLNRKGGESSFRAIIPGVIEPTIIFVITSNKATVEPSKPLSFNFDIFKGK